jgi:hypothetical protein
MGYEDLYVKVRTELAEEGVTKDLLQVCSVALSRQNEKQIDLEFLENQPFQRIKDVKKKFDKIAKEEGYTMNYRNLSGSIFDN